MDSNGAIFHKRIDCEAPAKPRDSKSLSQMFEHVKLLSVINFPTKSSEENFPRKLLIFQIKNALAQQFVGSLLGETNPL